MGNSNETKKKIIEVTKELILQKGYTAVTMNEVSISSGISTGGLYYHYHSVEEILNDIVDSETDNVWESFKSNEERHDLLKSIEKYFDSEKEEMLHFTGTLNAILYEYYFSHPYKIRQEKLKEDYEKTFQRIMELLSPFILSKKELVNLCNHIFITLHGLNFLAMTGQITEDSIDYEFNNILSKILELSNRKRVNE